MIFIVVNYHYIEDEERYKNGIHPVSPKRFKSQLQELGKFFEFVSKKDVLNMLGNKNKLPGKSCMITFDDGLRSQYENALPILDEMKIPAIFFVNGQPFNENKAMLPHKIHWCRSKLTPEEFINKFAFFYERFSYEKFDLYKMGLSDEKVKNQYIYDTIKEARIKFLLNMNILEIEIKNKIIDEIFKQLVCDEKEFCKSFYIDINQIKDLYKRLQIGIHGYSHQPLGLLTENDLEKDFKNMFKAMDKAIGDRNVKIDAISYPYGARDTISNGLIKAAERLRLKLGFTTERAFNISLKEPLLLARLNANDVPYGKNPLFKIKNCELKILDSKLKSARNLYFDEYNVLNEREF